VKMTRKKPTSTEDEVAVGTPAEKPKKKRTPKKEIDEVEIQYPEFNIIVKDDCDELGTKLIVCSNNGSDKKKTLYNARKRRMKRPILIEIDCEETSYKLNNFSLTVDEAKSVIGELQRMVDYLEEI
jgi:hypothetical protein